MDKELTQIPYYLHEGELVRAERVQNRFVFVCIAQSLTLLAVGVTGFLCWKKNR